MKKLTPAQQRLLAAIDDDRPGYGPAGRATVRGRRKRTARALEAQGLVTIERVVHYVPQTDYVVRRAT